MRHRRRAFLARRKILLDLADLGPLQVTNLGRQALDRGSDDRERGEIGGVAVAWNHLGGDRLRAQAEGARNVFLDAWVEVGEGAYRARQRRGPDLLTRGVQAAAGADKLGVGDGELHSERRRLG